MAGGAASASAASASASASSSASSLSGASSNNDSSTPPTSVLAGGIVGGVAGLAVLLLVATVFLRWYRRRAANMRPLTEAEAAGSVAGPGGTSGPSNPGMAQRAGIAPVLAPLLGGGVFKSRREAETGPAATGERGFQRVSGRKLPSAFSEGMEGRPSPQPMPVAFGHDRDLSHSSFYRDSTGFHGGEGSPFDDPTDENEVISPRPGPARQPTLHPGGPWAFSPTTATTLSGPASPSSPTGMLSSMDGLGSPLSPPPTAPRSNTPATLSSFDGSRGSRFTEEV